jgi:hypothetical protein
MARGKNHAERLESDSRHQSPACADGAGKGSEMNYTNLAQRLQGVHPQITIKPIDDISFIVETKRRAFGVLIYPGMDVEAEIVWRLGQK